MTAAKNSSNRICQSENVIIDSMPNQSLKMKRKFLNRDISEWQSMCALADGFDLKKSNHVCYLDV